MRPIDLWHLGNIKIWFSRSHKIIARLETRSSICRMGYPKEARVNHRPPVEWAGVLRQGQLEVYSVFRCHYRNGFLGVNGLFSSCASSSGKNLSLNFRSLLLRLSNFSSSGGSSGEGVALSSTPPSLHPVSQSHEGRLQAASLRTWLFGLSPGLSSLRSVPYLLEQTLAFFPAQTSYSQPP